jgi:MoaA/NifB/PqqE/SkfB family radical SAM enzyme
MDFFQRLHLIIELTNECNMQCMMCSLWKSDQLKLSLADFKDLMFFFMNKKVNTVSITGGEPFILQDLLMYYNICIDAIPKAHIDISTNGYYVNRISDFCSKIANDKISITISFDGIKSHEKIRGVPDASSRVERSAKMLVERGFDVALKMTIIPQNSSEILQTAKFAQRLGTKFFVKLGENIECHHGHGHRITFPEKLKLKIVPQLNEIIRKGQDANTKHIHQIINLLSNGKSACMWPTTRIFVSSNKDLWLCRKKYKFGEICNITSAWKSPIHKKLIRDMKNCRKKSCLAFRAD